MVSIYKEDSVSGITCEDDRIKQDFRCENLNDREPSFVRARLWFCKDSSLEFHLRERVRVRTSIKKRIKEEEYVSACSLKLLGFEVARAKQPTIVTE